MSMAALRTMGTPIARWSSAVDRHGAAPRLMVQGRRAGALWVGACFSMDGLAWRCCAAALSMVARLRQGRGVLLGGMPLGFFLGLGPCLAGGGAVAPDAGFDPVFRR